MQEALFNYSPTNQIYLNEVVKQAELLESFEDEDFFRYYDENLIKIYLHYNYEKRNKSFIKILKLLKDPIKYDEKIYYPIPNDNEIEKLLNWFKIEESNFFHDIARNDDRSIVIEKIYKVIMILLKKDYLISSLYILKNLNKDNINDDFLFKLLKIFKVGKKNEKEIRRKILLEIKRLSQNWNNVSLKLKKGHANLL